MSEASEIPELPGPDAPTFWNGEPCPARQVRVIVADDPRFDLYWARPYVGQERDAVEVTYSGSTFYLDDDGHAPAGKEAEFLRSRGVEPEADAPGQGWAKVTLGRGSWRFGHRSLAVEPGSVRDR